MTDCQKLNKIIEESGISFTALSSKMGLHRRTLYNKVNGATEFKVSEIIAIQRILHMTSEERDSIFFASNVN